jgi:hypothetical protein
MKNLFIPVLFFAMGLVSNAQSARTETLQNLEQANVSQQNINQTATMTSASRLFGAKDDLTTVILIIPSGSTVRVLDSDSTYYLVGFEDLEGYIFKRHAAIDKDPVEIQQTDQVTQFVETQQTQQTQQAQQTQQTRQTQQVSRFSYLESKYGSNMAARLISGKIWKGMNSAMVKDSWGTAEKINRVISGNIIKEEWIFSNTWLYFENNTLLEWGPVQ